MRSFLRSSSPIQVILKRSGIHQVNMLMLQPPPPPPPIIEQFFRWILVLWHYCIREEHNAERRTDVLIVGATVIAAMNYQAAISSPGGVYQDTTFDNNDAIIHLVVQAVAAYVAGHDYRRFCIANTISFTCFMPIIFLFISGVSLKSRIVSRLLTTCMYATITTTTYSFKVAMEATTPAHDELKSDWIFVKRLVTGL